eukprot:365643-Chlamydomonas_euryale.AAC.14
MPVRSARVCSERTPAQDPLFTLLHLRRRARPGVDPGRPWPEMLSRPPRRRRCHLLGCQPRVRQVCWQRGRRPRQRRLVVGLLMGPPGCGCSLHIQQVNTLHKVIKHACKGARGQASAPLQGGEL